MRQLERNLGLFGVVAISIGAMLGGEIFVLPAVAAELTGRSVWLAYLVSALLVLPAALSQAELATAMPMSGGAYMYIERALGPVVGTTAGLGLWLSLLLKSTFALVIVGRYLAFLVETPTTTVALLLLAGVVSLNIIGVQKVGRVQTLVVAVCLAALAVLVILGAGPPTRPIPEEAWLRGGPGGFASAVGLVFISYAGVTKIAAVAEEVQEPDRTIPRGILLSLVIMGALYTGIAAVLTRAFPISELARDPTPIASLAAAVAGSPGRTVIAATAVLALVGMANAGLLASSRFPFAMARDRLLPPVFSRVSHRFVTPVPAIAVTGVAMAVMLVSLDVIRIAKLASAFMIASFCAVNLAVLILRESDTHWYKPPFRSPLYPWIQGFGFLTGLEILLSMGSVAIIGLVGAIFAGLVLFVLYGRRRVSRRGVLRQMGQRHDLGTPTTVERVSDASTVVLLFGNEPSAEALVHLGMTMTPDDRLEVLYLEEAPEQTESTGVLDEVSDRVSSLERRLLALGKERNIDLRFDLVLTRDLRKTVHECASRIESRFVVMAWRDRTMRGFIVRNPLEWLMTHLPCNLALFKDAGIRTYRRIMVVAVPGPHDALVVRTADELAVLFRAEISLVRALPDSADEKAVEDARAYHNQLSLLCHEPPESVILRGDDPFAQLVKATARYDLVVLGAPAARPWRSMFVPTPEERLTEHALCAVLRLQAPRERLHDAIITAPRPSIASPRPTPALDPAGVVVQAGVTRKDQLFGLLAREFVRIDPGLEARTVEKALWEREHTQNTALGRSVAIPHAVLGQTSQTRLVIATLAQPIPYGGTDDRVDLLFCLVGPLHDRESHLRLLSRLAELISTTDLLERLRQARGVGDVHQALLDVGHPLPRGPAPTTRAQRSVSTPAGEPTGMV